MGFFSWIILGLIAGAIAKAIHPGKDPGGCLVTPALGVGGAMLGGAIGGLVTDAQINQGFSIPTLISAILGSLAILVAYRFFMNKYGPSDNEKPVVQKPDDNDGFGR